MNRQIQIVVVDDHPVVLQGFEYLLKNFSNIAVAATFTNGTECLEFIAREMIDIVLLDINLPDINGIVLCREIKKVNPNCRIIGISNSNERDIIFKMLQSGASGYILKNASAEELEQCINNAMNGNLVLSKDVQQIMAEVKTIPSGEVPKLTRREREILKLIADGCTTNDIAGQLYISISTVESHRRNMMQKFDVNNSVLLIRKAAEMDLI